MNMTVVKYQGKAISVREDPNYPLKYVKVSFSKNNFVKLLRAIDVHSRLCLKKVIWRGGISVKHVARGRARVIDISTYSTYLRNSFKRGKETVFEGYGFYNRTHEMVVLYPEGYLYDVLILSKRQQRDKLQQYVNNAIVEELAHACQPVSKSLDHYGEMLRDKYKPHLLQLCLFYAGIFITLGLAVMKIVGRTVHPLFWLIGLLCFSIVIVEMVRSERKVRYPRFYTAKDYENDYFEIEAKKLAQNKKLLRLAGLSFKIE